ncbi:hypothetical protein QR680_009112 [Steinernema hermaphroditum]|uniref:Endonuclease/exonuclease/phosphatase domain-containing protein n=1 Tax=Steinernema hermaphroditum TaxID=289476 RepID=A0AA39IKX2_9BILA|nr:hypothetical protein QR680_009112 [Steinernema hermaphroditum]
MFHPQKPRIVLGTLNVRRLASVARLIELQEELATTNIDAIALTEPTSTTRSSGSTTLVPKKASTRLAPDS